MAQAEGERFVNRFEGGSFIRPAILVDVPQGSEVARTEIFGPGLSLMQVNGADEAIELVDTGVMGFRQVYLPPAERGAQRPI